MPTVVTLKMRPIENELRTCKVGRPDCEEFARYVCSPDSRKQSIVAFQISWPETGVGISAYQVNLLILDLVHADMHKDAL